MRTPRLPVFDWTEAPRRFKWTRPFRRKTNSGFWACAITLQLASTTPCNPEGGYEHYRGNLLLLPGQKRCTVTFISLPKRNLGFHIMEPKVHGDSVVGIVTGYGLDSPGIESRGGEIFRTCPDRPWGSPTLLYNEYRVFPGGVKSGRGVTLTPHSLLVPWSRKSTAIPLVPLWAVRPVQSLSACTRVHFTFFRSNNNI